MEMAIHKKVIWSTQDCFATEGPSQKFLVVGHPTDLFWGKFRKETIQQYGFPQISKNQK